MRYIGGVICSPEVLDRIGIGDDDDADELPLPAKMDSPDMDMWSPEDPNGEYRTVYDNDLYASSRRTASGAVVSLAKLRG